MDIDGHDEQELSPEQESGEPAERQQGFEDESGEGQYPDDPSEQAALAQRLRKAEGRLGSMSADLKRLQGDDQQPWHDAEAALREELAEARREAAAAQAFAENAAHKARYEAVLDARCPGWEDETAKPEFSQWVNSDAARLQLAASDRVADGIELMDDWNRHLDREKAQRRLQRSVPATRGRGASNHEPGPSEEDDFRSGFRGG